LLVYQRSTRTIDQVGGAFHLRQLRRADDVVRLLGMRRVDAQEIHLRQHVVEMLDFGGTVLLHFFP